MKIKGEKDYPEPLEEVLVSFKDEKDMSTNGYREGMCRAMYVPSRVVEYNNDSNLKYRIIIKMI